MKLTMIAAAVALLATPALAAPCRDAKGKFVACSKVVHTTTVKTASVKHCHDAKGRFHEVPSLI